MARNTRNFMNVDCLKSLYFTFGKVETGILFTGTYEILTMQFPQTDREYTEEVLYYKVYHQYSIQNYPHDMLLSEFTVPSLNHRRMWFSHFLYMIINSIIACSDFLNTLLFTFRETILETPLHLRRSSHAHCITNCYMSYV